MWGFQVSCPTESWTALPPLATVCHSMHGALPNRETHQSLGSLLELSCTPPTWLTFCPQSLRKVWQIPLVISSSRDWN